MRLRDENKRRLILTTAARLFSEQPYHKVKLDDVAGAAGIGKGTVYIYFQSKEDLYYSMIAGGFNDLVEQLKIRLAHLQDEYPARLRAIVTALVRFGQDHPELFEVMRTAGVPSAQSSWDEKRRELAQLIEENLQRGTAAGAYRDSNPRFTSLYISGMVRAVMLYIGTAGNGDELIEHILELLTRGILVPTKGPDRENHRGQNDHLAFGAAAVGGTG